MRCILEQGRPDISNNFDKFRLLPSGNYDKKFKNNQIFFVFCHVLNYDLAITLVVLLNI